MKGEDLRKHSLHWKIAAKTYLPTLKYFDMKPQTGLIVMPNEPVEVCNMLPNTFKWNSIYSYRNSYRYIAYRAIPSFYVYQK